jgi:hypothetical protein
VTVKAGATKKGDVLEISLDLDLALPKEIQACDASCVSQADCGVGAGSEGFDYPVCEEDYEGGPRVCRILCDASGAGCTAHGGHCSGPACTRKGCGDLSGGVDCKTLDATNCDTCCDLKNAEANTQNLALIVDTCGCAAGSPCESECKPTCTKHDVGSYEACLNCLTTDAAHTCFTAALKKCAADPACSAYHECVNACPM